MTTHHDATGLTLASPDITRSDRARFVKEARRLRAEQIDRLLLAVRRSLTRLWSAEERRATTRLPSGTVS